VRRLSRFNKSATNPLFPSLVCNQIQFAFGFSMSLEYSFVYKPTEETPETVVVTGSFDEWAGTLVMEKNGDVFERKVTIQSDLDCLQVQYKFIVDGAWKFDASLPTTTDEQGNENNVVFLYAEEPKPLEAQNSLATISDAPVEDKKDNVKKVVKKKKHKECLIL
jgi:hypothetical protein